MISEPKISECPEFEIKPKIGNIFVNEKILEEYSVKIYKIYPCFYDHYGKKHKLIKMGVNIYYLELTFILNQKMMKKVILTKMLLLRKKDKEKSIRKKALGKKLGCKFVRVNTSKKSYNASIKPVEYKTFISEFKNEKLKQKQKKNQTK